MRHSRLAEVVRVELVRSEEPVTVDLLVRIERPARRDLGKVLGPKGVHVPTPANLPSGWLAVRPGHLEVAVRIPPLAVGGIKATDQVDVDVGLVGQSD